MEVRENGWVKTQTDCGHRATIVGGLRQDYPFISGRVAHHVIEFISGVHLPAAAEEKATTAVLGTDPPVAGQEGQRRVRKWHFFGPRDANEIGNCCYLVLVVEQIARVEEAGELCLGELLAVLGVGCQWRETHLNRQIDLTGSRDRISTMRSSVRSAAAVAALALFLEPEGSIRGRK